MKNNLTIIIKIGSSSLVNQDLSINEPMMYELSKQLKTLLDYNCHPILVSSGAIAVGRNVLGLSSKPKTLSLKQACAAVGQAKLMENYNKAFDVFKIKSGQVLLSHDDFQSRKRINYLKSCLNTMIENNIIPIINENDVVSVDEIKVGDNDTLSSLICPLVDADMLIILSDIDGLYDSNPQENKDAKFISEVKSITDEIKMMAGSSKTSVGTGGMATKIRAAEIASNSGCKTMIMNANKINKLYEIVNDKNLGTLFYDNKKMPHKTSWLIYDTRSKGAIIINDNLNNKLSSSKKVSILPIGIIDCEGEFLAGDVIDVMDTNKEIIAKGITNYGSYEIKKIMSHNSKEIKDILGYKDKEQVIHADDLVVFKDKENG